MTDNKKNLIKLNGTMITSDGVTKKTNYFSFLDVDLDDYGDVTYTEEEATRIRTHLSHLVTGASAAVPIFCGGVNRCPFSFSCPFVKEDKRRKEEDKNAKMITPLGKRCIIEVNLLREWTKLFLHEYKVDEQNFTEFMMVRELAEIELMLWRLNNNISKPENAELVQETVVGTDREGNVLTRLEASAFLEAKDRLQNRKTKLIKLMVGDRQEKYKKEAALKIKDDQDASSNAARLRGQIDRLMTKAKDLDFKVKKAEGKVIDIPQDESIEEPEDSCVVTPEDLINE